jgi:hypothetical protein
MGRTYYSGGITQKIWTATRIVPAEKKRGEGGQGSAVGLVQQTLSLTKIVLDGGQRDPIGTLLIKSLKAKLMMATEVMDLG